MKVVRDYVMADMSWGPPSRFFHGIVGQELAKKREGPRTQLSSLSGSLTSFS